MRWNVLLPSKFGSTLIIPFTHVRPRLCTVHLDLQSSLVSSHSLRNFQLVPRLFVVNSFSTLLIWKKMKLLLTPGPGGSTCNKRQLFQVSFINSFF